MGNTYSKIYIHLIFGTKNRESLIQPQYEERLKAHIAEITKNHDIKLLVVNGTEDHMHLLVVLPPAMPISKAVQLIKGGSSKWLNQNFFGEAKFRWERGYGAFSVNESMVPTTIRYINQQKKHHSERSFENEFEAILDKHSLI